VGSKFKHEDHDPSINVQIENRMLGSHGIVYQLAFEAFVYDMSYYDIVSAECIQTDSIPIGDQ
jgi:hypothetical protein